MLFEFLITVAILAAGVITLTTIARLFVRARDGRGIHAGGMEERLARLESTVEALAVETRRTTEGHRFLTQLLTDRPAGQEPPRLNSGNNKGSMTGSR
jgi:hypothetical protein